MNEFNKVLEVTPLALLALSGSVVRMKTEQGCALKALGGHMHLTFAFGRLERVTVFHINFSAGHPG